jgi:hypothetical protein
MILNLYIFKIEERRRNDDEHKNLLIVFEIGVQMKYKYHNNFTSALNYIHSCAVFFFLSDTVQIRYFLQVLT